MQQPTHSPVKNWPPWFVQMLQDMLDMRDAQRDYFESRNDYKKRVAIAKEQKADMHLESFVKAGVIAHKEPVKDHSLKLF